MMRKRQRRVDDYWDSEEGKKSSQGRACARARGIDNIKVTGEKVRRGRVGIGWDRTAVTGVGRKGQKGNVQGDRRGGDLPAGHRAPLLSRAALSALKNGGVPG